MMFNKGSNIFNAISIDVEGWDYPDFCVPQSNNSEVFENTIKIIDILQKYNIKATFFIVGKLAEKLPNLVKKISNSGHEIGTHGYTHKLIYNLTPKEFKFDLEKSIDILEQLSRQKVLGYRAPYASITQKSLWALDIICGAGLQYDCSIFPTRNFLYGLPSSSTNIHWIENKNSGLVEFPFSVFKFLGKNIPVGGGFYLRLFPYALTKYGLNKINKKGRPAMIYIHPRELDLNPPKLKVPFKWKLIYYYNLKSTLKKFEALLKDFSFIPIKNIVQKWIDKQS